MLFLEKENSTTTTTIKMDTTTQSKDEVDFVNANKMNKKTVTYQNNNENETKLKSPSPPSSNNNGTSLFGDCEIRSNPVKSSLSSLEKLHIFNFHSRKKSDPSPTVVTPTVKTKTKFVKSASIARLFGNNYNSKTSSIFEKTTIPVKIKSERFKKCAYLENDDSGGGIGGGISVASGSNSGSDNNNCDEFKVQDMMSETHDNDLSAKAMRTLSKGLGRLLRRRTSSVDISEPDPEFKVAYLGNVLTGWAKGKISFFFLF